MFRITIISLCALLTTAITSQASQSRSLETEKWAGTWFTCEFAKSTTPPHDGCEMFDDEGFRFDDGRLTYIRVIDSEETECRGGKVGQCFARDQPAITIKTQDRGELDLGDVWISVRYFGCTQKFSFADGAEYREIIPAKDRCFWARKRHFYIARFNGSVRVQK